MIDCIVYLSSVANFHKHPRKVACLNSFAEGAKRLRARVHVETEYRYQPSRLAVILGWVTDKTGAANIALRHQIIDGQRQVGKHTMCIDASCWKYLDDHGTYLRYSIGGPYYDRAEYANHNSDATKWNQISQKLNIQLKPFHVNPNGYILICMQRNGGFAMKALDPMTWLDQKIQEIRRYTKRRILIRPHPGSYKMKDFEKYHSLPEVKVTNPADSTLLQDLQHAHSVVLYNSSSAVAAVCEGIPVFADDQSCVAWSVCHHDVAQINAPTEFNRKQWIYDLASAHWSDEEGRRGDIYRKFQPLI